MSALGLASLGVLCEDKPLGMASLGVFCAEQIIIEEEAYRPLYGGGGEPEIVRIIQEPRPIEPVDETRREQILREDDELLQIVIAAIQAGIIP